MASIAQITTFYENMGGVERSVKDLSLGLVQNNHDVTVLCTKKGASQVRIEEGVQVVSSGSSLTLAGRPVALGIAVELRNRKFDLKHFHLPCPLATVAEQFASDRKSIKVVSWHHGIGKYPLFEFAYKPALRNFLQSVDQILVTAPSMVSFSGVLDEFKAKCKVVPLGIEVSKFANPSAEKVALFKARYKRPLVLFVGRLVYYKGCEVLIKAMKDLDADLLISGEGPLKNELVQLTQDLGITEKVHFLGRVSDEDLPILYAASDMFVLPSVSPTECFGLVQVEAMLSGKPVINTSLPTGVPWVSQHDDSGFTVRPGDVQELAAAISLLLGDSELRACFGTRGKKKALSEFSIEKQVENTLNVYAELFGQKTRSRVSRFN